MRKHVPLILVLAVVAIGVVRIVQYHWRQGAVLIGAALVAAALIRALLPNGRAGLVEIRSRAVDILLYGGLGLMVITVAATIEGGPLNQ